jgi:hypothetical protein
MPSFTKTPKQREAVDLLGGQARHILLYGGSRSGKSLILLYAMVVRALKRKSRHLVLRFRFNHCKTSIWHDSLPKVIDLACPNVAVRWDKADFFLSFPNGSEIWIGGLDEKDRTEKILGTEYSTCFFNECSQITYEAVIMALTRLAENAGLVNRAYYDCNPPSRRHWAYRLFMEHLDPITKAALPQDVYASMLMNPTDNRANLPPGYIETTLETLPSRARDRFLLGKWLDVVEGALWLQEMIDQHRVTQAPAMERIVVAIDPAVTATKKSDETGIVVLGKCGDHGYALEDLSGRWSPQEWGKRALDAFYRWRADAIVAEVNQGGDLVEANLRTLDPNVPYHSINAMRGKIVRAEPIASLYEQGRVHHVGILPELEDQMTNWTGEANWSPDRLDAAVHGLTALLLTQPSGQTLTYDDWEPISPY